MITFFIVVFLVAAATSFSLSYRDPHNKHRPWCRTWRLWHTGVHTEYAGPGRVWFISFFRGRGYVVVLHRGRGRDGKPLSAPGWRPNIVIPGFTFMVRTQASRASATWGRTLGEGGPVRYLRLTTSGNGPIV